MSLAPDTSGQAARARLARIGRVGGGGVGAAPLSRPASIGAGNGMALGALISASGSMGDGAGDLYATFPLAGRTLLEYQARLAAAAGASPIVVLVERMPPPLLAAVDRLVAEGVAVQLARGVPEAASFFAFDDKILLIADGLFADAHNVSRVAASAAPAVMTISDDVGRDGFERIDGEHRWAGLAVATGADLAETAAMLGDWDLQSTLLRRLVQGGARHLAVGVGPAASSLLMAARPADLDDAERRIVAGARGARRDWVERHVTPVVEEYAVERLMPTTVAPMSLVTAALVLTVLGAGLVGMGWRGAALGALVASVPLDGIADRLAALRMQPLARGGRLQRGLALAAAAALGAFGLRLAGDGAGWGTIIAAAAALVFFHAGAVERARADGNPPPWLASRKGAILLAVPFAIAGWWSVGLVALSAYAGASFLWLQRRGAVTGLAGL